MIWFLVGLLALTVIVGVWYGAPARRRLLDAQTLAATRERDVAEILAATSEAFVSFDAGGAITTWSSNAERLFGWSAPEVMGKSLTDTLIPVHDRPAFDEKLVNRPVGTQSAFIGLRVDTAALHRDGRELSVEMMTWARRVGGYNAFIREVTSAEPSATSTA